MFRRIIPNFYVGCRQMGSRSRFLAKKKLEEKFNPTKKISRKKITKFETVTNEACTFSETIDEDADEEDLVLFERIYNSGDASQETRERKYELLQMTRGHSWRTVPQLPKALVSGIQTVAAASKRKVTHLYDDYKQLCRDLKVRSDANFRRDQESFDSKCSVETETLSSQRENISSSKEPFVYTPARTMAYVSFRMPLAYSIISNVLQQVQIQAPHFRPHSVLDFGAGPGTALWAAQELWPHDIDECVAVEPARSMVVAGQALKRGFEGPEPRWYPSVTNLVGRSTRPFSLVIAANVFGELPTDDGRAAALRLLWQLTAEDGVLVLVEPGSNWGARCIQQTRSAILEYAGDNLSILGPCTHKKKCPLSGSALDQMINFGKEAGTHGGGAGRGCGKVGWFSKAKKNRTMHCHFPQRGPEPPIQPSSLDGRSTVMSSKFSYISIAKTDEEKFNAQVFEASKLLRKQEGEDIESRNHYINDAKARILGHPMKRKGLVIMDLCNSEGITERRVVTKGKLKKESNYPGSYRAARKAEWGGRWPHFLRHDEP